MTSSRLELIVDSSAAQRHLQRLDDHLRQVDSRGGAAAAAMGKFGLALGAISAAAGGLGFSRIIRDTANFEDSMLGLQAVSGATTKQMVELEKQARTLGATTRYSAQQAGEAQRFFAQAGFDTNEILAATPGILQLATAGQLDLARAADIASNALGQFQLPISDLARVNDVLATAAASANTNVEMIATSFRQVAPIASLAGASLEETAAIVSILGDSAIQGEQAGTGFRSLLSSLAKPSADAESVLSKYGLTLDDVNVKTQGLSTVMERIVPITKDSTDNFTVFGQDAATVSGIIGNSIPRYKELTGELESSAGAAEAMAEIIGSGLSNSILTFNSGVSESILKLGEGGLGDAFGSLLDSTSGVLAVYNGLLPEFAEANDLTETQIDRIETLAGGVDMLKDAAIIAAGIYTGRFVAAMAAGTVAMAKNTQASIARAKTDAAAATASASRAAENLRVAQSEQAAAQRALANSRATTALTGSTANQTRALHQLAVANQRVLGAQAANTAALNTQSAAMGRASVAARAMGAASRGAAGAMALMGGPLGILVGAAGLLYVFRDELNLTGQRAGLTEDQIRDLRDEMQDMSQDDLSDSLSTLNSALDTATLKAATAREELASLRADLGRGEGGLAAFREVDARHELAAASNAVADAEQRIAELNDRINVARGETASRIEENANAYVVYADRIDEAGEATRLADEFTKTLSASTEDAADKTYTLSDAYDSLLDRITPNRREARQYARDLGVLNLALASGRMNTQQYMQAMGMLQESFQAAQRDTTDIAEVTDVAADEMARAWEEASNRIDETFSDAFAGAFDSFDDFGDQLLDGFKRLLAELAYQATLKPIVVQMTGQMQGMMGMGGGQQGGGGFNLSSMGSVKNAWGAVQNGFGGIQWAGAPTSYSGGFAGSATSGMSVANQGTSYLGGSTANFGGMTGLASAGTGFAGGWAGGQVFGESEAQQIGATIGTVAGTYLGGPIGAAIGSFLGSGVGSIFGHEETPFSGRFGTTGSVTPGTFEHQGSDSEQFYAESALGAVGFMDDGTERLQRAGTGSKEWAEQLATSTAQMDNLVASLAQGAPELDAMRSAVQGLEISSRNAGEIIEFALDERPRAAIDAMSGHFGEFVKSLEGGIESVVQQAQVAQQAHSVLSNSMGRLSLQFDAAGAGAYGAASNIAELVGGTANLSGLLSGFYDSFYTEEEKFNNLAADLSSTFSDMGRELPTTREGVRDLVEGLQLMGTEGQEQLATVLQLTPALREYVTAMDEQRASIEEANRAALAQQMFMSGTTADVSSAIDAYNEQLTAIDEVAQARKDQLEQEMRAVEQLSGLIDSLMLSNQSILDPAERLQEAQRQFAELQVRAEGGDMGAISQLQGASSSYLDAAAAYYGQSSSQYADIFGDVNDGISDLERSFGDSLDSLGSIESIEERALQEQKRALSVLESSLRSEIDQVQSLNNMTDLLGALPSELASILAGLLAKPAGGGGGGGPVTSADIQNSVGSVTGAGGFISDSGARDLYNSALENGVSLSEVQKYLPPGNDAVAWAERNGLPVFADGAAFTNGVVSRPTMFDMGMMGEAGAEGIMPLANIGGELGVRAVMPPMPEFPMLNTQDISQVMRDMQQTIERQGQQITQLLQQGNQNTAQTRDAVVGAGKQASVQREQQKRELNRLNKKAKLKERVS